MSKIFTAQRLQKELGGGEIVFFYHDSDHDYRETITLLRDRQTGEDDRLNFRWANKIQKKYTPLYLKDVCPIWQEETARRLPRFAGDTESECFQKVKAKNAADFCLDFYQRLGLLDGITVERSSDPKFRISAREIDDFYVDVPYRGETVRARSMDGCLKLHCGGNTYIELPKQDFDKSQVSPTRDSRLTWMQSVIACTHYVAGASEVQYLKTSQAPDIEFIERDFIEDAHHAYIPA